MRRFLSLAAALLAVVLLGCSGDGGAASGGAEPTTGPTAAGATESPASGEPASGAPASAAPSEAATTFLPAECAEGLGAYLAAIEPLVSKFDPAKDTLGALYKAQDAAREKAIDLLKANDDRAPYSCSEVGLEFAYFDTDTPWDAVLVVAGDAAPGTLGYLNGLRAQAALDEATLADYGIDGCDAAVRSIKKDVKGQKVSGVDKLAFDDGTDLLGRYKAYMHEVQNEACPRDQLGNDEFGFMGSGR
jgi:hypothetical protein